MGNILDMQRKRWYGHAVVPLDYFPPNVNYFNAYSIHNQQIEGQDPIYKALYPSSSAEPDFHDLESFRKFSALPLLSTVTENSDVWDDALFLLDFLSFLIFFFKVFVTFWSSR